jgi:hypothetical protein
MNRLKKTVFAAFLCLVCLLAGSAWADMPKITCKEPVYDFGAMENSKAVDHVFTIANEGKAPLQTGQIRACCGATATISEKVIQPGSNAIFHVVYSLAGRSGVQAKSLYIASNDPRDPYLQLRLTGTAVVALDVMPRYLDFGVLEQTASTNREITIHCKSNMVLNVTNVVASTGFAASLCKTGELWKIKVSTAATLPLGVTRGNVTIYTNHKDYLRIEVPLTVTIAGDIVVTPKDISVVEFADQKPAPVTRYVSFRSRSGKKFNILNMTPPDPMITVEKTALASGGYRITLGNIMPFEDLNGKDFVVTTDYPLMKRIAVPFVFHHQSELTATNKVSSK